MKTGSDRLIERFPGARFLYMLRQIISGRPITDGAISAYGIGPVVVLVQQYDDGGWQLYVPASPTNDITATLDAVAVLVDPAARPKSREPAAERLRNAMFTLSTGGPQHADIIALVMPLLREALDRLEGGGA